MLSTAFIIGGVYTLTRTRKTRLNVFSFLVMLSLFWWSFCNVFFFSTEGIETAWVWHRLGSLGWTAIIPFTAYYFVILTGAEEKLNKLWHQLCFYSLPAVIAFHNLFAESTCLATGFVKSNVFNQWAYVNSPLNLWLWVYLLCLTTYFGYSFFMLLRWRTVVRHRMKKQMAVQFVILDALTILLCFITDVFSPLTNQSLPAMANLCTILFGAGYFLIIIRSDLFNLYSVVPDRTLVEHSTAAVMVIDEAGEILYCNPACSKLFDADAGTLMGRRLQEYIGESQYEENLCRELANKDTVTENELHIEFAEKEEMLLVMSAYVVRNYGGDFLGTVVSLRDTTQLNKLKEQYRLQSKRFERMAYEDTLTGLPNRRKTFETLEEYAVDYTRSGKDFFLLFMDMDYFKTINDQYGHRVGDLFLKEVADRLARQVNGNICFLGRLSGDELIMIGRGDVTHKVITGEIRRIKAAIEEDIVIDGIRIQGSVSVGFAKYSDFLNIDEMVHHADAHMYGAKQKSHTSTRETER